MQGSAQLALAGLALALSCLIAIYVGVRTLLVWRRTRAFPELAIGINVLSLAIGGALFAAFVTVPGLAESSYTQPIYVVMIAALMVHPLALAGGTWRIFRPHEQWPLAVCLVTAILMAGYGMLSFMLGATTAARSFLYEGTRLTLFMWTAYECFRYRAQLLRRAKIGLADPMIAHRIGLWGIASSAQIGSAALAFLNVLGTKGDPLLPGMVYLYAASLLGVVGTVCIALTFFPPRSYTRRLEEHFANESH